MPTKLFKKKKRQIKIAAAGSGRFFETSNSLPLNIYLK